MGGLTSSENSLNQHIKLKHPELWSKFKSPEGGADRTSNDDKNGHGDIRF
jgi:hypothetical protein